MRSSTKSSNLEERCQTTLGNAVRVIKDGPQLFCWIICLTPPGGGAGVEGGGDKYSVTSGRCGGRMYVIEWQGVTLIIREDHVM